MQTNQIMTIGVSVLATAVGATAGYIYAKKQLTAEFEETTQREIAEARDFYAAVQKKDDPEKLVEKLIPETDPVRQKAAAALSTYQGQPVEVVTKDEGLMEIAEEVAAQQEDAEEVEEIVVERRVEETVNILVDGKPFNPDMWDIDAERANRDAGRPYVITEGEWSDNPDHYDRSVLTYFVGDDTLVDEDEAMIDDVNGYVGEDNLKRFGHGTGDPNVVFVRNEQRGMDFEILRHTGNYAEEVLGLVETDESLEHSAMPRRGKRLID